MNADLKAQNELMCAWSYRSLARSYSTGGSTPATRGSTFGSLVDLAPFFLDGACSNTCSSQGVSRLLRHLLSLSVLFPMQRVHRGPCRMCQCRHLMCYIYVYSISIKNVDDGYKNMTWLRTSLRGNEDSCACAMRLEWWKREKGGRCCSALYIVGWRKGRLFET